MIATPGRLLDFIDRGIVSLLAVKYLILDEADRMLDMGFKDDINRLVRNPEMPGNRDRNTLMFSATFPDNIQRMASEFMREYLFISVGLVGGACQDVTQSFHQEHNRNINLIRRPIFKTIVDFLVQRPNFDTTLFFGSHKKKIVWGGGQFFVRQECSQKCNLHTPKV